MRLAPWLVAGVLLGLFFAARAVAKPAPLADGGTLWTDNMSSWLENLTQESAANEARYRPHILKAEQRNGLPAGLLSRLLYQESRYRSDIITGETRSPAGALGIAQFMPATAAEYGINPLDPYASINAAAQYLRRLYNNFGNWPLAVMAYNWGWGNVSAYQKTGRGAQGQRRPSESVAYVSEIIDDVGIA